MIEHFGLRKRESKIGMVLTRSNYVRINNRSSFVKDFQYDSEYCRRLAVNALINYDINMNYFSSLDRDEFKDAINNFLESNKDFCCIKNLKDYDGVGGYYLMILDEYCQAYIGTTGDILKRMNQHWHSSKQFDRLIFGGVSNSILSIDSFKVLDTTRLYAMKTSGTFSIEDEFINSMPEKFMCNRTIGGKLEFGLIKAIVNRKTRELNLRKNKNSRYPQYYKGVDATPEQMYEIYEFSNNRKTSWNTDSDGLEIEVAEIQVQGEYGVYTLISDLSSDVVQVKEITNLSFKENLQDIVTNVGNYLVECEVCGRTYEFKDLFHDEHTETYGVYSFGLSKHNCKCNNTLHFKYKFMSNEDESISILDFGLLNGKIINKRYTVSF